MKLRNLLFIVFLLLVCHVDLYAQNRTITGKVTDAADGSPLIGVTVTAASSTGKMVGASTNLKGEYSLLLPSGYDKLTFSYIGMESRTENISNRTKIDIKLLPQAKAIDNVVVTALGIKRQEKSLNYSRQGVDAESMSENQSGNFVSSLAGKIAGVDITPPGVNNGTARIVIRGVSSFTENAQPLFVVDGMIMENQPGDGAVGVTGAGALDYGNPAADINPNDIENIEILKGPNAAALYGSRAAQGVILITTKKAASFDKVRISYNGNLQMEAITQWPEYQNGWGTGESGYKLGGSTTIPNQTDVSIPNLSLLAAGAKRRSWGAPLWGQKIIGFDGQETYAVPQPDNVKDFYNMATRVANTLSIDGGNKNNNYRASYTNNYSNSVVHGINNNLKHTFNIRLFNTITKWMNFDTKLTYSREKVNNRQYMNGSDRNPIYAFATLPRDISIDVLKNYKDANGNETIPIGERGYNPYWNIYENTNSDTRQRITGSANMNINMTSYLKFVGKFGFDTYGWNGTEFNNLGALRDKKGSMSNFNTNFLTTNLEGMMMFDKTFFRSLSVNAIVGASMYSRDSEKRTQSINTLIMPDFPNISNTSEYPIAGQTKSLKKTSSVYGSLSLGYKGYAFLDITGRNDWSSTLKSSNRSYFYPSFGGAFIVSDAFKISNNTLSLLKFRGSYALAGADTEPYRINQVFSLLGLYHGAPMQSISGTLLNPDLKPEMTASMELGFDLRMFQNRFGVDVTYYDSNSFDLITSVQLPYSSGYSQRYLNTGKIRNWGWEVILTGTPIKNKNFQWNTTINWSKNNSMVLKVIPNNPILKLRDWNGRLNVRIEEGMPYGVLRGREWLRDDQGRKLVSSTGSPLSSEADAYLGNAVPKWSGSFRNTFKIKNFDVGMLIDARIGGTMFSGTYRRGVIAGVFANTAIGREEWYRSTVIYGENSENLTGGIQFDNVYFEDGTPSYKFLKPNEATFSSIEEMQCFDASFIKLREVSVGYTIPRRVLAKLPFESVKVSLVGRNLWIIHQNTPKGIDPEASTTSGNGQGIEYGSIPPVSSFGIDVRLTF